MAQRHEEGPCKHVPSSPPQTRIPSPPPFPFFALGILALPPTRRVEEATDGALCLCWKIWRLRRFITGLDGSDALYTYLAALARGKCLEGLVGRDLDTVAQWYIGVMETKNTVQLLAPS